MVNTDTRIKYKDIDYYCMQCQQFITEAIKPSHVVCERLKLIIKKDENDELWQRIKREQGKRLNFE